ncbi:MAG: sel1 repeat family protein [Gallionella sp.]|nr:MAG: sel1 repeat family protein [Gallionella sp.]
MSGKQGKWLLAVSAAAMAAMAFAGPEQDAELAEKAYGAGDVPGAMELFRKAAAQNNAGAQVRLAELLDAGDEDEEAVRWLRKAAEQGSAAGELGLGLMYLKGEGIGRDSEKAIYWFRRAAERNYLPAVEFLARGYRMGGFGAGVDIEQAQFWEARVGALKGSTAAEKTKTKQGEAK